MYVKCILDHKTDCSCNWTVITNYVCVYEAVGFIEIIIS